MKYENDSVCKDSAYSWHDKSHRYYYYIGEPSTALCHYTPGGYDAVFQHIHEFLRREYPDRSVIVESQGVYLAECFNSYGLEKAIGNLHEFQNKRLEYYLTHTASL